MISGKFSGKSGADERRMKLYCFSVLIFFLISLHVVPLAANQKPTRIPEKIVIASDDNYPPYIFRDENGNLTGYLIDIWSLWEKKTGTKVEWIATDWSKAFKLGIEGKADIIETAFYTSERVRILSFSKPYAQIKVPVYYHKSLSGISGFSTLKGFTIGAKAGDASIDVLKKNGIKTIVEYPSYEAIINDAIKGNIKVFTIDEPPALYYFYRNNIHHDYREAFTLYTGEFHRASLKERESTLEYVENGFSYVDLREIEKIRERWMGKPLVNPLHIKYAAAGVIIVALIITILLIFNYFLRRQVRIKTNQLNETYKNLLKAEARWKFAIEGTEQGLWDWSIKTGEVFYSPQWKKMLGFSEEEISNSLNEWEKRVHPDDLKAAWEDVRKHFTGETGTYINEHRVKCKDGTYKWILDRGRIIETDENGEPVRMIGTHTDITLKKENEKLLEEKEALYRFLFEHNPAPMLVYERGTLNILAVNESFTIHYGYNKEEAAAMILTDLYPDNEKEPVKKLAGELKGYAFAGEWHHIKKDGTQITILAYSHDLNYENRKARVAVITDISYLKEIEKEMIKARNKAEESDRLKTAFLANMSHEIRTPMNAILGFMQLLKNPGLKQEERINYTEIIEKSGERLLSTINNIIEISKIETGLVEIKTEKVSVNELIGNIFKLFRYQAEEKGLDLRFNNADNPDSHEMITDRFKLETILINLIGNAIKFTVKGFVEAGYSIKENLTEFYVKDSGPGIPHEKTESVFKPFVQAENGLNRSYEGSGLGLAITKAYINMLGGTITLDSVPGEGCTFYFTIPHIPGKPQKDEKESNPAFLSSGKIKQPARLLIAEDDEASFLFIKAILSGSGIALSRAKNGKEVLEILRANPDISLILLDIKMPVMDGYEAARHIREFNKTIPLIAQSALAFPSDMEKALEAGFSDYITKPIDRQKLINLIQKYLTI